MIRSQHKQLEKKDAELEKKSVEFEKKDAELIRERDKLETVSTVAGVLIVSCRSGIDAQLAKGPDPSGDEERFKWILERVRKDFRELVGNKAGLKLLKYLMHPGTEKLPAAKKSADEAANALRDELEVGLAGVGLVNVSIKAYGKHCRCRKPSGSCDGDRYGRTAVRPCFRCGEYCACQRCRHEYDAFGSSKCRGTGTGG